MQRETLLSHVTQNVFFLPDLSKKLFGTHPDGHHGQALTALPSSLVSGVRVHPVSAKCGTITHLPHSVLNELTDMDPNSSPQAGAGHEVHPTVSYLGLDANSDSARATVQT